VVVALDATQTRAQPREKSKSGLDARIPRDLYWPSIDQPISPTERGSCVKVLRRTVLVGLALLLPAAVGAQEVINPPPVGGGTSYTRTVNGQQVDITTWGPTQVDLTEISPLRIAGVITRLDPNGPTSYATIRWVNRGLMESHSLSASAPPVTFSMESGDVDKRTGGNDSQTD
jgi:hypothetical protein